MWVISRSNPPAIIAIKQSRGIIICYEMRWFFKFFDLTQSFLFIIYINDFDSEEY